MKVLHFITFLLLVVGWLNWWLVGIFEFDLVAYIFGEVSMLSRVVYTLVWVSALIEVVMHPKTCKMCSKS